MQKAGVTLVDRVECAVGLWDRMRGLLGRDGLGPGRAMHLARCGSIHTFGMRFKLDLVFLSRAMKVCRIVCSVPRNRMVGGGVHARSVIEMEAGWFPIDELAIGDTVCLVVAIPPQAPPARPQRHRS